MDIATHRMNWPRGQSVEKFSKNVFGTILSKSHGFVWQCGGIASLEILQFTNQKNLNIQTLTMELKSRILVRMLIILDLQMFILFLLVIDWILKTTKTNKNNGIQWTPWKQLEDLYFSDDLAVLSHNCKQMQDKTNLSGKKLCSIGIKNKSTKN